jgi:hypothetical protein
MLLIVLLLLMLMMLMLLQVLLSSGLLRGLLEIMMLFELLRLCVVENRLVRVGGGLQDLQTIARIGVIRLLIRRWRRIRHRGF